MYDWPLLLLFWLLTISSAIVAINFGVNADRFGARGKVREQALFVAGSIISAGLSIMIAYWLGEMGAQ